MPQGLRLRHDNGSIFLARHVVGTAPPLARPAPRGVAARQAGMPQEFLPRSSPESTGGIERFVRTLKQECVWLHRFETFEEAERIIMAWIERYNTERQHSALGSLTPRAWRDQFYQLPQAA